MCEKRARSENEWARIQSPVESGANVWYNNHAPVWESICCRLRAAVPPDDLPVKSGLYEN